MEFDWMQARLLATAQRYAEIGLDSARANASKDGAVSADTAREATVGWGTDAVFSSGSDFMRPVQQAIDENRADDRFFRALVGALSGNSVETSSAWTAPETAQALVAGIGAVGRGTALFVLQAGARMAMARRGHLKPTPPPRKHAGEELLDAGMAVWKNPFNDETPRRVRDLHDVLAMAAMHELQGLR